MSDTIRPISKLWLAGMEARSFTRWASAQIRWHAVAAWYLMKQLWRDLPGPWYVKVLILVVTQAIPGPQDELLLLAVLAAVRKYRARKEAAGVTITSR